MEGRREIGGKQVQVTFKEEQSHGAVAGMGESGQGHFSLVGRNYSKFVQLGARSNKKGKTDDSGEEEIFEWVRRR